MSLLLEGGLALHTAAWNAGVVDAVHLYRAPVALGADGVPWLGDDVVAFPSLFDRRVVSLGPDLFMEGYVHRID
jgi:riboflavin biosynthesis pyrimidine reductase